MKNLSGIVLALLMSTASLAHVQAVAQASDTPLENKKATIYFQLTPSATRSGTLTPGENAAVTYYLENGRPVVIELAGIKK